MRQPAGSAVEDPALLQGSELVRRLFLAIFMQFIGGQLTILEAMAITTLQAASGNALAPHSHDSLLVLPVMFYLPVRCG